ncbi:MAG: PAS domain-containing protein, partial [Anaerolineaceae bacterium]|nr:PAS domain-containing protein [Anaerolineaceae bacterium]
EASDHRNTFVTDEKSAEKSTAWGFETESGEFAGFFCLEGLSPADESEAQIICGVMSEKCRNFHSTLSLRKENYISKFENSINDIVNANIIEGVIITDEHFDVMYINPVAATMFGFSSSQVVGHKLEDLLVTSDGIQGLVDREDKDGLVSSIKYLHRRSGKIFPCQIKVCKMESGYDSYNIFVLSDQTETEESRLKTEQLTQKAFLGDFASLLAHEIRNPINNIQMWIANLYTLADGNEEFLSGAKRVENDFQRITQLVNNILAFSKPIALNKEEIDLSLLLSEIIEKWRLNFVRKNITCYFNPPQDFPKFYGDPRSLEQVFNNLIGNSVDAFDGQDGIITLKLSLKENESGRKQILISESDNGPGIPEDKIDSIFEPFMTTKKNGNGWGLALSKRIITTHKGTIQVKSFQGGGTVFEILLPLTDEMG